MKLGDTKLVKKTVIEKTCENCGEPATKRHTFLYEDARRNLASSAYGKDDCSWCSDEEKFSCNKCSDEVRRDYPRDMGWCSTFSRERFEHMFLEWKEEDVKEQLASEFMKQFSEEVSKSL